ncbi:MAG: MBL fold metallo-hydrolase [Firmicutes bacterium]|nr:MBL fold metallo-hydrolase [Bacillota bacterium]
MLIECLEVGAFAANCYLVACPETKEAVVIDPGAEGERINNRIVELGLKIKYIINTHGHVDHIGANGEVKEKTGVPLLIHQHDAAMCENPESSLLLFAGGKSKLCPPDRTLKEGDEIKVGSLTLKVLETPGHTRGSICLLVEDALFSGDTIFAGSIGRTDLPGGSYSQIIDSLMNKIVPLPDKTKIYPGHGPATTVEREKAYNPFLQ